ncbi:protein kinase [Lentinula lateritia]|uniref:Protein kinase n=1 Tax=Lentinula lateritia TaxID=40482 RepID=A0ABQ8V2U6_9AGAR|nr:protein kinase [Lentinula lateritia]
MEPLPQNPLPDPAPLPQTPKTKQANGPPVVESTPTSKKYASHAEDEVPQRASVVNKFLEDDIGDSVVLSLDDFATLILELPVDWKVKEEIALQLDSDAVKDAFEAYLSVAIGVAEAEGKKRKGAAGHETQLYRPLANLLNVLKDSDGEEGRLGIDINEKIFYVQDPRPVLGSRIERKPDLGGIYIQLLKLTEGEELSDYLEKNKKIVGVFWGLLLYFVEVKHRKGNFIGMSIRKAAMRPGPSSRAQSDTLPSIAYVVSQSATSTPLTSTSASFGDEPLVEDTIQALGGTKKTMEVVTSQEYARRAEAELRAEQKMSSTQGQRHTRIQCASYAKEMLSNGFIRNHAMGITADDSGFRFQYYDRSKVVESQPFHILNDESKTLLMAMVCQLNKLSTEKLGFIPNLDLNEFDHLRNPEQLTFNFKDDPSTLVGATYTFTGSDGRRRRIRITKVLYRAEGIIGRCSIVVEVVCLCEEADCVWHEEGNPKTRVMKISFPSKTRPCEDGLIGEARSKAESSGQRWALNHLPEVIDSITFPYHEHTTVQGRLKKHLKDDYEERVMRVTFLEKLHPLSELTDPREYAQVFYDILQIHQWLYECVGILHRDLSSGNIMYRRIDGKVYGVLNDFDLSSRVRDMDKGPTSNQRTGTRPFMSVDLLSPVWEGGHLYRHDLESLFYIMLCLACRYNAPGVPAAEPRSFSLWFSGTDREIFNDKTTFLLDRFQSLPIQSYFAGFQRWLRKIYDQLRGGYIQRPFSATNLSTSNEESAESEDEDLEFLQNDNDLNFDWNTLNRHVSYARMRSVMSSFKGKSLQTRWVGNPDH